MYTLDPTFLSFPFLSYLLLLRRRRRRIRILYDLPGLYQPTHPKKSKSTSVPHQTTKIEKPT